MTMGYDVRYKRTYMMLKAYGHCASKALEIVIDASRGDEHALMWIRIIHKASQRRSS